MGKPHKDRFYDLVKDVRTAQKRYFRDRNSANLENSKRLEITLEKSLLWIRNKREPTLINDELYKESRFMLEAQRNYFAMKTKDHLKRAKSLESKIDKILSQYANPQINLNL